MGFDGFLPAAEGRRWVNAGGVRAFADRECHSEPMRGAVLGGKWGLVDESERVLVEPRFDGAMRHHQGRAWANLGGRACATHGWSGYWFEGGLWLLVDLDGRELTPPRFEAVRSPTNGVAWARRGRWGLIDLDGRELIPPRFDDVPWRSPREPAFVGEVEPVAVAQRWGLVDRRGEWILPPTYDHIFDFHEGFARVARWLDDPDPQDQVARSGLFSFIDARGRLLHPLQFTRASDFSGGVAKVTLFGRSALLDAAGALTFR